MEDTQYFLHLIQNVTYSVKFGNVPDPSSILKKLPVNK